MLNKKGLLDCSNSPLGRNNTRALNKSDKRMPLYN